MPHIKHGTSDISAHVGRLSGPTRTLWAKSDFEEGVEWLPLYQHIADSAAVAGILWDDFLPESTKRAVALMCGGDRALARKLVVWLAASHDLGKASPAFAVQVERLREAIERAGLPFHPSAKRDRRKLPHSMASYLLLRTWLTSNYGFTRKKAAALAAVSLGHHGMFSTPPSEFEEGSVELLGTGTAWEEAQKELADFAAAIAELTPDDFARLSTSLPDQSAVLVASGFTILSDWVASNAYYFPLQATPRDCGAASEALDRLGLPPAWRAQVPDDPHLFADHLGLADPRPLQTELVRLARTIEQPELFILEAPTGDGKTKAALGACEVLADRFGLGGVLFALPTQATSDGIFGTVRDWLDNIQGSNNVSLSLAHGKAAFNPDFQRLAGMSRIFDDEGGTDADGRTIAHSYLTGRAKLATMSDFVVGTIDQLLLGALRSKHVALRHLGVAGKVVVVDEVHASDTYMRRYLCSMLTWLAAYGVPVIAMSATLTPSIRHELVTAYNEGLGRATPPPTSDEVVYPRLTVTTAQGSQTVSVPASTRASAVSIDELAGDTSAIAEAALDAASHGGNIAVVCDTVRRAQDIFRILRNTAPDADITLLHSRFLTPDRIAKEQSLRERLGPDSERGARPLIVVGTQVIEQSLDIDFDVMFSDIAPIDLLIQRAGRLHRHEWKNPERPVAHRTPRLILTGFARVDGGAPDLDRGCRTVYGASALFRCLATLDEHFAAHEVVASPADVAALVTRAYESIEAPAGWEVPWAKAEAIADEADQRKRLRAQEFLIDPPARRPLVGWGLQPAPDPTGERGAAQVRDSEDSIEVVVVQSINGHRRIPSWAGELPGKDVDLSTVIDDDVARAAARNTLRLPGFLGRPGLGDELIGELEDNCIDTWQNSRWLRGALPLVLDADGDAEHAGHHFHYDTDLGLVVTPLEKR